MSKISDNIKLEALRKESAKRRKKALTIKAKIDAASSWGSDLLRSHNEFVKNFNKTDDVKVRLSLIDVQIKEKARLEKISEYDISALIDEQVKLESEAYEIECEISVIDFRSKRNKSAQ